MLEQFPLDEMLAQVVIDVAEVGPYDLCEAAGYQLTLENAKVVSVEHVSTEKHGRVRVRFYWDRAHVTESPKN